MTPLLSCKQYYLQVRSQALNFLGKYIFRVERFLSLLYVWNNFFVKYKIWRHKNFGGSCPQMPWSRAWRPIVDKPKHCIISGSFPACVRPAGQQELGWRWQMRNEACNVVSYLRKKVRCWGVWIFLINNTEKLQTFRRVSDDVYVIFRKDWDTFGTRN